MSWIKISGSEDESGNGSKYGSTHTCFDSLRCVNASKQINVLILLSSKKKKKIKG